jgi:hypothetical protein
MDRAKQYVTSGHISGKWFSRFMRGARLKMGMIRKQNEALTSVLAMAVWEAAEARWSLATEEGVKEELEDTICFMLAAFGFDVDGGSSDLLDGIQGDGGSPHGACVKGHFKGEVDKRWHLVPVSDYTCL